jgi:hypothetical protein
MLWGGWWGHCKDLHLRVGYDGSDEKLLDSLGAKPQNRPPEDRLALEKEIPALIAARDKAVTAAKRKQLQKETAQIPNHVAKMRR